MLFSGHEGAAVAPPQPEGGYPLSGGERARRSVPIPRANLKNSIMLGNDFVMDGVSIVKAGKMLGEVPDSCKKRYPGTFDEN